MAEVNYESPLSVMNKIRKGFRAKAWRLARKIPNDTIEVLDVNEELYNELHADIRVFLLNRDLWTDELPHTRDDLEDGLDDHDEEGEVDRGEPIYPEDGPGAGYSPEKVRYSSRF